MFKKSNQHIGCWLTFFVLVFGSHFAHAQEYVLEQGDKISITFWQDPNLNTEAIIDSEGKIDVPVIGRLTAASLTVSQLSSKIAQKMSIFNPRVTQALVKVLEYGSKKIFVTGAVYMPGPYSFEKMPNVWEAILAAGGAQDGARLDHVVIIRGSGEQGQTIPVDLTAFFDQSDFTRLPELRPNDNIYVPGGGGGQPGAAGARVQGAAPTIFSRDDVVYIYGQVMAPGYYQLEKGMDVLQAIIAAGGPAYTQRGAGQGFQLDPDLEHVRVISHSPEGPVVYHINLEKYAEEGAPRPLLLKAGDTIYVPQKQTYTRFVLTNTLRTAITGTVSILLSYFLLNKVLNTP